MIRTSIILLVFYVTACACSKSAEPNQSSMINLKECFRQSGKTETISLCFDSLLTDSRCPKNAVCIWQGVALARFTFSANNHVHTFILSTSNVLPPYVKDTLLEGYKIQFVNLYPYPGDAASQVKAEVKISP